MSTTISKKKKNNVKEYRDTLTDHNTINAVKVWI